MVTSRQRRAAERRRLRRQAERRRQQESRRRRLNVLVSVIGVLVVVGVVVTLLVTTDGSDPAKPKPTPKATSKAASTSAAPTTTTTTAAAASTPTATAAAAVTTCAYPTAGTASRKVAKPPTSAPDTGTATLRLATSQGAVTVALNRAGAPCAVNSLVSLVRQKFYDGTACHRLVDKSIFVLQCGDPTGTGRGGPGYTFADELGTGTLFRRASVVMANGGPNTNGSQFFIVDRDTRLGSYTPLGTVTSGLSVVDAVYRAGTSDGSTDGPPKLRFAFRTATIA